VRRLGDVSSELQDATMIAFKDDLLDPRCLPAPRRMEFGSQNKVLKQGLSPLVAKMHLGYSPEHTREKKSPRVCLSGVWAKALFSY
jgi:hypothetical protein